MKLNLTLDVVSLATGDVFDVPGENLVVHFYYPVAPLAAPVGANFLLKRNWGGFTNQNCMCWSRGYFLQSIRIVDFVDTYQMCVVLRTQHK